MSGACPPLRAQRRLPAGLLALALLVAGCGPTFLLPGGELAGTPAEPPADWDFTSEVSTIQLETRPTDPYSVNIWAVGVGDALYVHAGTNRANWVDYMEADPRVRVRVQGLLYPLAGARVVEAAEFARFAEAYEAKYGLRPRNENVAEAYLYRLVAR